MHVKFTAHEVMGLTTLWKREWESTTGIRVSILRKIIIWIEIYAMDWKILRKINIIRLYKMYFISTELAKIVTFCKQLSIDIDFVISVSSWILSIIRVKYVLFCRYLYKHLLLKNLIWPFKKLEFFFLPFQIKDPHSLYLLKYF